MSIKNKSDKKKLSWYMLLIIYCLENGKKKLSEEYIAENIGMKLDEFRETMSMIRTSGIYDIVGSYIHGNLSLS